MNITETNILNVVYNQHRILIDRLDEYGMDGELATSKKMCTVINYDYSYHEEEVITPMIFNVSPYTPFTEMFNMAKVWIDCGCPSDANDIGIPRKWTKESLHEWVSS